MNKRKSRTRKDRGGALLKELRDYEREGTHLYLGNHPSGADEIVRACVLAEDSDYMWDYVGDEEDRITEIHFIRVSRGSGI